MRITLRQIEIFEKVTQTSSYTKAAKELCLSQPAVSMQISQLEEQIGSPLFELIGRRIFLTEGGEEFSHYCKAILRLVAETKESMQALRGLKKGKLKVAVSTSANHLTIGLLADFKLKFPTVQFEFEVCNRQRLIAHLDDNTVDIIIMEQPPEKRELIVDPFLQNPMVVIAPNDHPLKDKAYITLEALSQEMFVAREEGSGTRLILEQFFEKQKKTPKIEHVLNSNDSIKKAVSANLGLAISSIHTIEMERQNNTLCVLDVVGTPILKPWFLVHNKGKRLSPVANAFRTFILEKNSD